MKDERIKEALKPCPFCGGEGEIYQGRYLHENWARCKKCKTQIGGTFTSPLNAIKAWNTRAAILDDSVVKENLITDYIPDTGKKLHPEITNDYVKKLEDDLAIAVKALEDIKKIGKAGPAFETHFSKLQYIGAVTNDALKEIQG